MQAPQELYDLVVEQINQGDQALGIPAPHRLRRAAIAPDSKCPRSGRWLWQAHSWCCPTAAHSAKSTVGSYRLETFLALLSGHAVFTLMLLAVVSVSGCNFLKQPLSGYVD